MLIVSLLELLAEHTDARRIDVLAYSAGCQVLSPALAALAATKHGVSRAGRPDKNELSEEETQWVIDASRELPVDFISVSASKLPGMARGAHDFWYSHPWVSTDVLIQLLFEARPADRGLEAEDNAGTSPAGSGTSPTTIHNARPRRSIGCKRAGLIDRASFPLQNEKSSGS